MPDTPIYDDRGVLMLSVGYNRAGTNAAGSFVSYYELFDAPDVAYAVNDGPPILTLQPHIGYVGDAKTDPEIQDMLTELQSRFLFATKGYIELAYDYLGRASLPGDGEVVAGSPHDYVSWWNGLSHSTDTPGDLVIRSPRSLPGIPTGR
jgi:hypothetical protein